MAKLKPQREYVNNILLQVSASVSQRARGVFMRNLQTYAECRLEEIEPFSYEEIPAVDRAFINICSTRHKQKEIAGILDEFFRKEKDERRYAPFREAWRKQAQTLGFRCCTKQKNGT